jgi:hypothetical protein
LSSAEQRPIAAPDRAVAERRRLPDSPPQCIAEGI